MDTAKITSKGQVTIPKAVRSRMAVRAGDRLAFEFEFANRAAAGTAIQRYAAGKADFSDYQIGESASLSGASVRYTFDRELARTPGLSRPV